MPDRPSILYNKDMIKQTNSTPLADALLDDELFITPYTDACYNEADVVDIHADLVGDDYADAMMRELGL